MGFPVLVKAALGGGGKGMKLATKEEELQVKLSSKPVMCQPISFATTLTVPTFETIILFILHIVVLLMKPMYTAKKSRCVRSEP